MKGIPVRSLGKKGSWKELLILMVGAFVYSIGTHCFVEPANIAPGGAVGIALMFNYITGMPTGILTLCVNLPLLVLAWLFLSRRFTVRTALTCIVCSLALDFLVAPIFPAYAGERLLSSLYGGVLVGIGMAFIFLAGSTTGGSDIAGYLLQKKYPHISIGRALLMVDGVILSISIAVFENMDAALFGLICLYAQTKVIDMIIYGSDAGSKVSIVTAKAQEISRGIIEELDRSATILKGAGAYSGKDTYMVVCTVRKQEFRRLKNIIERIDKDAFVMVTEAIQVFGLGFKGISEAIY